MGYGMGYGMGYSWHKWVGNYGSNWWLKWVGQLWQCELLFLRNMLEKNWVSFPIVKLLPYSLENDIHKYQH